jgi:type I restriction enzyme S subunit
MTDNIGRWPAVAVEELCLSIVDCVNRTAPIVPGATPYRMLRTSNVKDGFIDVTDNRFVEEGVFRTWTRRQLPIPGDIILTREAPLGEVGMIRPGAHVFLGQRLVSYRTDPTRLDNRFLLYYFRSHLGRAQIMSFGMGSTVAHMRVPDAKQIKVPVPPIHVQRRVGSLLGAYDDLIEVNQRRVAVLEDMARGLFEEWFVRFRFPGHDAVAFEETSDGAHPQGWRLGTLDDLVELRRDKTEPGDHLSSRAYVPIECIGRRSLALDDVRPSEDAQSSLQLFSKGDILFGAMRAYFHKVAPAPLDGVTRSTCFVLRPREAHLGAFALMTLYRDETVAYAAAHSKGSTIPYAQWGGVLERMRCIVPRSSVLSQYQAVVQPMVDLIVNIWSQNRCLKSSRDLLLPRLISGQLSVEAAERELEEAA